MVWILAILLLFLSSKKRETNAHRPSSKKKDEPKGKDTGKSKGKVPPPPQPSHFAIGSREAKS